LRHVRPRMSWHEIDARIPAGGIALRAGGPDIITGAPVPDAERAASGSDSAVDCENTWERDGTAICRWMDYSSGSRDTWTSLNATEPHPDHSGTGRRRSLRRDAGMISSGSGADCSLNRRQAGRSAGPAKSYPIGGEVSAAYLRKSIEYDKSHCSPGAVNRSFVAYHMSAMHNDGEEREAERKFRWKRPGRLRVSGADRN